MTTSEQKYLGLAEEWDRLMDASKVPASQIRTTVLNRIVSAYSEPHRHYHNLNHVAQMLSELFPLRGMAAEPNLIDLATWFHDFVYDPHSKENESRSADLARSNLEELNLSDDHVSRVCDLILMTARHQAPGDDEDAKILMDVDLSILAKPQRLYRKYAEAIRKEYSWLSDRDFLVGRKAVMASFLMRSTIYQTDCYRSWYEAHARANIAAEIAQIDEKLRALA